MPIEYILLGVGIVLLGIEAVVPGFGFFGVTGLISLLAGSYYLLGGLSLSSTRKPSEY